MVQVLLFSIYVMVMGVLILAVVDEPISGVVILIIGAPITAVSYTHLTLPTILLV